MIRRRGPRAAAVSTTAAILVGLASTFALGTGSGAAGGEAIADEVFRRLQQGREAAGAPPLTRRPALDAAARDRAEEIAALPAARRLALGDVIDRALARHGVRRYRQAIQHVDLKRGYRDPAAAFVETWRAYAQAWRSAVDPARDAVGLATTVTRDGWTVLVAVLLDDRARPPRPRDLERRLADAVNRVREEQGRPSLQVTPRLTKVARAHSRDMLRQGYFDHVSPIGAGPADRVRAAGLGYRKVAENIQLNSDDDPVGIAVESWMASPPHRRNILDPEFAETGVGAALHDDGTVYFTQVFLHPSGSAIHRPAPTGP